MADAATVSVLIQAKDEASRQLKNVEGNMGRLAESFGRHRRSIGLAATAIGAAVAGIAAMSVKSALDQEIGIRQLDAALGKVGTSYEKQKKQIEEVVAAQQNKTNFGDEEQRDALRELILVSGNYDDAMKALVPTMELAAGKEMDLGAAATLVARAISGEETALGRYGIEVEKGAGSTAVLTEIMNKFGGQAEAAADPTTQLKNRMGDLFQQIGIALLPVIEKLVPLIEKAVRRMIEWTEAHPQLTTVLVLVGTALGAVMLVLGPMLLILPQLFAGMKLFAAGIRLVTAATAANPVGIILVALTTLAVVALPLVMKNWDKIWTGIKRLTETVVNFVIGLLNKLTILWRKQFELIASAVVKLLELGSKLPFVGDKFQDAADSINGFSDRLADGIPTIDITTGKQEELQGAVQNTEARYEQTSSTIQIQNAIIADSSSEMASDVETSLSNSSDAFDAHAVAATESTEKFATQVQYFKELNKNALEEVAKKAEETESRLDSSLESLRHDLDETNVKWKESGLTMQDVAKRWADSTRQSIGEVIDEWDDMNLDLDDTKAVIQAFADRTKQDIFNWRSASINNTEAVRDGFGRLRDSIFRNTTDIHLTLDDLAKRASDPIVITVLQKMVQMGSSFAGAAPPDTRGGRDPFAGSKLVSGKTADIVALDAAGKASLVTDVTADLAKGLISQSAANSVLAAAGQNVYNDPHFGRGRAGGGWAGGMTLVGERGPEIVNLPRGSYVNSHGSGSMGGGSNTFHFHGAVYGVEDLKEAVVEAVRDHAISGGFSGVFAEA